MKRMPFKRPTTHYDERINEIDERICELVKQRKEISNNNPGYPPFEFITNWADKYGLFEEQLKSMFSVLWNEKNFKSLVEPEGFQKILPVLKSIEIGNRLFSVINISQYTNSSIINFNIDWEYTSDLEEQQPRHSHFELFIDEQYNCRIGSGTGGGGHFHYNFIVSPRLPDNNSEIKLIFKEYKQPFGDKQVGQAIEIIL